MSGVWHAYEYASHGNLQHHYSSITNRNNTKTINYDETWYI
jgi:hypothetical protein